MDVVCLGILVADAVSSPVDSMPAAGQLKQMERYVLSVGGCAANTAVSLRRLGRSVKVVGKVGGDFFGDFVLGELDRHGIETSSIARSRTHQTSATLIVNVRGEDRRFIHCFGANGDFSMADVNLATLEGARALYVGGYLAMPSFGPADLVGVLRAARQRGLLTALDVVIAAGKAVSLSDFQEPLQFTDVFLPNDDEARVLTGLSDPVAQADALARINSSCTVVVTCGRKGVVAKKGDNLLRAGAYGIDAVDQSGAGDAFTAGFLAALLESWPLDRAIRFASAAGASATRALGCTAGVFTRDEALEFVAGHDLPIEYMRAGATTRS